MISVHQLTEGTLLATEKLSDQLAIVQFGEWTWMRANFTLDLMRHYFDHGVPQSCKRAVHTRPQCVTPTEFRSGDRSVGAGSVPTRTIPPQTRRKALISLAFMKLDPYPATSFPTVSVQKRGQCWVDRWTVFRTVGWSG